ncbi:MAG TPA: NADH-quinone oxidoreductase subunit M [Thermoanaerobaculia bacterium]|nr:NADH-quinone oxidoreductase subunit M [Thermoanaerobaculia bacterium]
MIAVPHLLSWIVFLPAAGAALLLLFPARAATEAKTAGIVISLTVFVLSLGLWGYDAKISAFQFGETASWIPSLGITYTVGIDGISLLLVLLTTFLTPVALVFSLSHVREHVRGFTAAFLVLETGMLGSLVALDLALFYVFWEVMLVPMYFIIGIWGGKRKIYAAVKFFLFTMAGSLLMFLAILYMAVQYHRATGAWSFSLEQLYPMTFPIATQTILFFAFAAAFLVKVPVFPLHTWLPDAHTEAPTAGSIILAGVLLKLGVYGYLRFALPFFPQAATRFAPWLAGLALVGIVYGSMVAYAQKDMKRLVAYSSVAHLGLVMLGIAALTATSTSGAVLQSVNHGLSTGALFLLVGVLYERRHTREISAYGGVAKVVPVTATLFLIATLSSIGLPGLNGFVGEFLILTGTFNAPGAPRWWAVVATSGMILSAVYLLTLVQRVFWTPLVHEENRALPDIRTSEFVVCAALVLAMIAIGVAPNLFLDKIHGSVDTLLAFVREKSAAPLEALR